MIQISALNLVLILIGVAILSGSAGLLLGCCLGVSGHESDLETERREPRR